MCYCFVYIDRFGVSPPVGRQTERIDGATEAAGAETAAQADAGMDATQLAAAPGS